MPRLRPLSRRSIFETILTIANNALTLWFAHRETIGIWEWVVISIHVYNHSCQSQILQLLYSEDWTDELDELNDVKGKANISDLLVTY